MKVIISEGQLERVKSILTEGLGTRYNREVKLSFSAYGANLKGHEIDYILGTKVRLFFDIEIEGRSWGIKEMALNSITGPEMVDVDVEYYDEKEENATVSVPLKLDWSAATIVEDKSGCITIGDEVEVELTNDSDGNLIVKNIEITVYTL